MLTVIVETGEAGDRLPALLGVLTSAAIEGLVRDVLIAGGGPPELLEVLRDETGAELATDLAEAIGVARSDWLLVLPGKIRLRNGWLDALAGHLRDGGRDALVIGEGGALSGRSYGVLIGKSAAGALARPDLKRLRGELARGVPRLT